MRRKLFNLAALLSLLLCLATVAWWACDSRGELIWTDRFHRRWSHWTSRGFGVELVDPWPSREPLHWLGHRVLAGRPFIVPLQRPASTESLGVFYESYAGEVYLDTNGNVYSIDAVGPDFSDPNPRRVHVTMIAVPWPFLAVAFAALPVAWYAKWRRRQRRMQSHRCPDCAYDLYGNTSGVCPECGTTISGKAGT